MEMSLLATVSALALAGAVAAPTGGGDGWDTDCAAVTRKSVREEDGRVYNAQFRLRCPFSVASVHVSSSRSLRWIDPTPVLQGKRAFETLTCAKRGRRGVCTGGGLRAGTRVIGSFRVAGDPCEEPRMSVRIVVSGGVDGPPGTPVPAIGLKDEKSVSRPRGCG